MVVRGLTDLDMVRRLMKSAKGSLEAKVIKDEAYNEGYTFAMSLYGVLTNKVTSRSEYRRIEILSDFPLVSSDVELIYRWFQKVHPIKTYSIWLYNSKKQALHPIFEVW